MTQRIRPIYSLLLFSFFYTVSGSNTDTCNAAYGNGAWMGDGACDPQNLIPECDWDGGDCCACSCVDQSFDCGTDGYFCVVPDVLEDDETTCEEITTYTCPTDGKRKWEVENTTQVRTLAEAMNCSGGTFEVEWYGTIVMDTEIVVPTGTVLNITGSLGSSAVLDGGGNTRLFRVVNAYLQLNDVVVRNGNATFGGAITAIDSTVILNRTSFIGNTATDKSGGAMFIYGGSNVSFSGVTDFFNNTSGYDGGALFVVNSSVSWDGVSNFSGNSAARTGGALCVVVGSTVTWAEEATFTGNSALSYNGGSVSLESGSNASWSVDATFSNNSAQHEGGAIYVDLGSNASWSEEALFIGNTASFGGGGAIYIAEFSRVTLSGETTFMGNVCGMQGGAVSSKALDSNTASNFGNYKSVLAINDNTAFTKNKCGSNGGGLAVLNGLSVLFGNASITFLGNKADVAGGGAYISASGMGPTFTNATFLSNTAEIGGGVFVTGSATSLDDEPSATFEGCRFIENEAEATGGAIESATGTMNITNTSFKGNKAGVGGALRLAGATSLEGCIFEENISDIDGGQAISMIGYELDMENCKFRGNAYDCDPGMFFNESGVGNRFEDICAGCDPCETCTIEKEGNVSTCTTVMEHSTSTGGSNVTLMTLSIDPGYWRATNTSTDVLACYNADACKGGLTGSADFCSTGYKGPYCAICMNGYVTGSGFTCSKCSKSVRGNVAAVIVAVVGVIITLAVIKYVMSTERRSGCRLAARLLHRVPLQSVKIIIVAWQILTQSALADFTYPGIYQRFLNAVDVVSFDPTWLLSSGCFVDLDFHLRLLISTIGPIMVIMFLGGTYTYVLCTRYTSVRAIENARDKHATTVLLVMFLVYSSASSMIFQTFDCEILDDGRDYLRADYTIECDGPRHRAVMIYAGVMILVYPVGIPACFAYLLFRKCSVLVDEAGREDASSVRSISGLWKPYRPSRFYYEVIECGRRIVLVGVPFILSNESSTQITITLLLAFAFTLISEGLAPHVSQTDAWVYRLGHAVVFSSLYYALLLEGNLFEINHAFQNTFEVILVVMHSAMVLAVIAEIVLTRHIVNHRHVEDPWPRFRSARAWTTNRSKNGISRVTHNVPSQDDV